MRREIVSAIMNNEEQKLSELLDECEDINFETEKGYTPLHIACEAETPNLDIIKSLLNRGADVSKGDKLARTPVHLLMEKRTPSLQVVGSLVESVKIEERVQLVNAKNWYGHSALHLLAMNKEVDITAIKFLVDLGADVNSRDKQGRNVLMSCVLFHTKNRVGMQILEYLFSNGADACMEDNYHKSALSVLLQDSFCDYEAIKVVTSRDFNPKSKNKFGKTSLHQICENPNSSIQLVKHFLSLGCDKDERDYLRRVPLMIAFENQKVSLELAQLLMPSVEEINENSAPNFPTFGKTLIHFACENSYIDLPMLKFLVSKGANLDGLDCVGRNALIHSCINKYPNLEVMELLVEEGKNKVNQETYLSRPTFSKSSLHFLCENENCESSHLEFLLKRTSNVNAFDHFGNNVFDFIMLNKNANLEMIFQLLFFGAVPPPLLEFKERYAKKDCMRLMSCFVEGKFVWRREFHSFFPNHFKRKAKTFLQCLHRLREERNLLVPKPIFEIIVSFSLQV